MELQSKSTDIQLTQDQFSRAESISNRIETEIDRKAFCEQILKNINDMNRFEPNKTQNSQ